MGWGQGLVDGAGVGFLLTGGQGDAPPPVNRVTEMYKNTTFRILRYTVGKNLFRLSDVILAVNLIILSGVTIFGS